MPKHDVPRHDGTRIIALVTDKAERISQRLNGGAIDKGGNLTFPDTAQERAFLVELAKKYNVRFRSDRLLAYGAHDRVHLCRILADGHIQHAKELPNYGDLGTPEGTPTMGSYCDRGWGLFVAKQGTLSAAELLDEYVTVQLGRFEAIVLPTPAVPIVEGEFPGLARMIKGYKEYASELRKFVG